MFHLYLTTHDPNGALRMNEVLWEAGLEEHELRQRLQEAKRRAAQEVGSDGSVQMSMFELLGEEPQDRKIEKPPRPSIDEIADAITRCFEGKTVERREIYARFAEETYFAKEIDKALVYLQKNSKGNYSGDLRNDTQITIYRRS